MNLIRKLTIAIITLTLIMLCGCGDLVVEKNASKTAEIGKVTIDVPEGYRTYEEYQELTEKYGDVPKEMFEYWLEPVYGSKPEYKHFGNMELGNLSTNWFSKDLSEDQIWDGQQEFIQYEKPEEYNEEVLDIEGLEDVRLASYLTNSRASHMEGDHEVFDECYIALASFTYDGQVYLFELFESNSNVKQTTLKETRQKMVDILESIGTHLTEE